MVRLSMLFLGISSLVLGCAGAPPALPTSQAPFHAQEPAAGSAAAFYARPAADSLTRPIPPAAAAIDETPLLPTAHAPAEASLPLVARDAPRGLQIELPEIALPQPQSEPSTPTSFVHTSVDAPAVDARNAAAAQPALSRSAVTGAPAAASGSAEAAASTVAPAAAEAVVAPSTAAPSTVAPLSDPVQYRVAAAPASEVSVHLDGRGWIYLGTTEENPSGSGSAAESRRFDSAVEYRRRRTVDGETEIIVRAAKAGRYTLVFQRQDLTDGTIERRLVGLDVSPGYADRPPLDDPPAAEAQPERASAAAEDPHVVDAAARRAVDGRNPELAATLWRRNRFLEQPLGAEARRGLFDLAYQSSRYSEATDYARAMLDYDEAPPVAPLAHLADLSIANGRGDDALDLLRRRLALLGDGRDGDLLLFRLAQLYETDPLRRNLRSSLDHYRRITEQFPLSRYWEASAERIEYIERHFFHLR